MTFRNGCVYCHNCRRIGARSHHVHALTGKPHGGFALALEDYPPEVWRDFVFNQLEVAKKMGATPNIVQENASQALFEMVNRARASIGKIVQCRQFPGTEAHPNPSYGAGTISMITASGSAPQRNGNATLPRPRDTTSSDPS